MASAPLLQPLHQHTTHGLSLTNGHANDASSTMSTPAHIPSRSDSDLSELNDATVDAFQTEPTHSTHDIIDDDEEMTAANDFDDEDEEDAPGEDDADFDEDVSAADADAVDEESSSDSQASSRKRKAPAGDDDYMMQNPELYGLRRSGRARPSRRVVESSDEDEDDDEVNSGSRRKRQKTISNGTASSRREKQVFTRRSSPDSESDDEDAYGRSRSVPKKHKQRLQAIASGHGTPQLGEVRFSTRKAAKITNYNEDDDLGLSEEDTENMTPNYWTYTDDQSPAIDIVLNHRVREDSDTAEGDKHSFEFLIKWQGQAHYHATWHPWSELSSYRGFRRLENYFRKVVKHELSLNDPDVAPEDKERWNLDKEAQLDTLTDYSRVERVIGSRDGDDGLEYYVKWKGLFYDSCTWESADLVSEIAQGEIDRYLDRSAKLPVSDRAESNLKTRSSYKPFKTQPSYIKGGELREFQIHGVNFLAHHWCRGNNVILADEMGLGKTVQTVSFMNWLRHDRKQQGPFIVVVPLSTMPAWADTFNNWAPDLNYVVYNGGEAARKIIREHEMLVDGNPKKVRFNALLTTYEYILHDASFLSQLNWQFMAVDEAHRLKNRESQLYARLMEFGAPSRLLITGTPMQNTLSELSALMDFLMPGKIHVEEDIDLMSKEASEKLAELTNAISPYMIRRTKQKVENDLPPKTEKIIRVEVADVQLEYYQNILTRNYAALNAGSKAQKTSLLNIMMELKKASNHPFMFPGAEERILGGNDSREDQLKGLITSSGKMMLLDRLLTKMKKDGHRVLIFSQMVKMLDILSDYLQLRGYQYQRLDGTIAAGPRRMAIDHFNAPESQDFCFLLSTRAGGLGINLMTADTVILFDSDWNPQADLQAMARAHRIGQKNPVTIYRLVSKDTIEEEILERARNKLMLEFITIQRGVTDKDARELGDRAAKAGANTLEPTTSDDISRILKRRGQKMFEQTSNQRKLEELDIDAVLQNAEETKTEGPAGITTDGDEDFLRSFEYTDVKLDLEWDDIIPKDQLEKIKEEERKRKEAAQLEDIIEQNQPRKRKAAEDTREQRAAKKRARDLAVEAAADIDSGDESDAGSDPKRPLGEKEIRLLTNAFLRYGAIEDKEEDIIRESRLGGRDINVVRNTLKEVLEAAAQSQKEDAEQEAELERTQNKSVTKKEKKAVLFTFGGVKRLNAQTMLERPEEMRIIRTCVETAPDWRSFRIPEASKPAAYSCQWGAKEDGMLCVGLARHGYGAWVQIRDDHELGLADKLFLEEHRLVATNQRKQVGEDTKTKSPGAVHLVRRVNYLLSVLKDKTSQGANPNAKKMVENHHRNNRRHPGQPQGRLSTPNHSGSPAPGVARKTGSHRPSHSSDIRASVDRHNSGHGSPNGHRRVSSGHHGSGSPPYAHNGVKPRHAGDARLREFFFPIEKHLIRVSRATKKHIPASEQRLAEIKECLIIIGKHITDYIRGGNKQHAEQALWDYVSDHHWPHAKAVEKSVNGDKLCSMFYKIYQTRKDAKPAKDGATTNGVDAEVKAEDKPAIKAEEKPAVKVEEKPVIRTMPPNSADRFKLKPKSEAKTQDGSKDEIKLESRPSTSNGTHKASSPSAVKTEPPSVNAEPAAEDKQARSNEPVVQSSNGDSSTIKVKAETPTEPTS